MGGNLGHGGAAFMHEIGAFIKGTSAHYSCLPCKDMRCEPATWQRASPEPGHAATLITDFQPPEQSEINVCCV